MSSAEIEKLENLLKQGLLSEGEFEAAKQKVLSGTHEATTQKKSSAAATPQKKQIPENTKEQQAVDSTIKLPDWLPDHSEAYATDPSIPAVKTNYGVAKNLAAFLLVVGWISVAAGLITSVFDLMLGLMLIVGGLLQIAATQIMVAVVDNADHIRKRLLDQATDEQAKA